MTLDLTALNDTITSLAGAVERSQAAEEARATQFQTALTTAIEKLSTAEPTTPSMTVERRAGALDAVHDRFDQMGYKRGDFEIAAMMFEGAGLMRNQPQVLTMPEDFRRAWIANVFPNGHEIVVCDNEGKPKRTISAQRAMDSAESGFGSQLIGAQYVTDMWMAARTTDTLLGRIRSIAMSDPTTYVPIDGSLPSLKFVGESTSASASAYPTSKTGSNRVTLTAKKATIQEVWSGELDSDSIIAFAPFLREKLNMSAALHLGSAMYNGDTTNAGTGNINLDDADPDDNEHFLMYDGIRKFWLVTNTAQRQDMAGVLNLNAITKARGKLNGVTDIIATALSNINWGTAASDLLLVCDWDTYMSLLNNEDVVTVDKYGPNATIQTGELGRIYGIPIVSPSYAVKSEADGKLSTTEASNTKGHLTIFNPKGWLAGRRNDVQFYFDRIQRTDQFLFEMYVRTAFTSFGANVAAGVYDITLP